VVSAITPAASLAPSSGSMATSRFVAAFRFVESELVIYCAQISISLTCCSRLELAASFASWACALVSSLRICDAAMSLAEDCCRSVILAVNSAYFIVATIPTIATVSGVIKTSRSFSNLPEGIAIYSRGEGIDLIATHARHNHWQRAREYRATARASDNHGMKTTPMFRKGTVCRRRLLEFVREAASDELGLTVSLQLTAFSRRRASRGSATWAASPALEELRHQGPARRLFRRRVVTPYNAPRGPAATGATGRPLAAIAARSCGDAGRGWGTPSCLATIMPITPIMRIIGIVGIVGDAPPAAPPAAGCVMPALPSRASGVQEAGRRKTRSRETISSTTPAIGRCCQPKRLLPESTPAGRVSADGSDCQVAGQPGWAYSTAMSSK
jgi:hypothetical protein